MYDSVADLDREESRAAARDAMPDDSDRPDLADLAGLDDPRPAQLDTYLCNDPWTPACAAQGRHLHGVRPDGVRV